MTKSFFEYSKAKREAMVNAVKNNQPDMRVLQFEYRLFAMATLPKIEALLERALECLENIDHGPWSDRTIPCAEEIRSALQKLVEG